MLGRWNEKPATPLSSDLTSDGSSSDPCTPHQSRTCYPKSKRRRSNLVQSLSFLTYDNNSLIGFTANYTYAIGPAPPPPLEPTGITTMEYAGLPKCQQASLFAPTGPTSSHDWSRRLGENKPSTEQANYRFRLHASVSQGLYCSLFLYFPLPFSPSSALPCLAFPSFRERTT